jgi:hypothetical protein
MDGNNNNGVSYDESGLGLAADRIQANGGAHTAQKLMLSGNNLLQVSQK